MSDSDPLLKYTESRWNFSVIDILEHYGWYLLILVCIIIYVYRQMRPSLDKFLKDKADREYSAHYHKNPDIAAARIAAQQTVTQRLQDKYKQDATEYQRKMEEKDAKKREEWLTRHTAPSGHKLGNGSSSNKEEQNSLRPEYNPLMGDSSRSYRPQRKSPCSGGGCGKK
ncbi:hypothetical protein ILUMI_12728 [Ignelater luminosus]|uniref:Selenoprotein S n=1 Tax=Ignelater luminosus TaxID=2038154 RepID=A0A8K0GCN6_IGNLU|nr:hypothetical protein ILUMI_12728 [Ignelater luminosus]